MHEPNKETSELGSKKEEKPKEKDIFQGFDLGKKIVESIRENLFEKIGREKWGRIPLEERHRLEIDCLERNFNLGEISKEDLEETADYLEDANYHGPANHLRKLAGVPYWDFTRNEMTNPEEAPKKLKK